MNNSTTNQLSYEVAADGQKIISGETTIFIDPVPHYASEFESTDGSQIRFLEENRNVKITKTLRQSYLSHYCGAVIKVEKRDDNSLVIIDGQHSYSLCREFGYPFFLMYIQKTTVQDIINLNNAVKKWSRKDFTESNAKRLPAGNPYQLFLEIRKSNPHIAHTFLPILISGKLSFKNEDFFHGALVACSKSKLEKAVKFVETVSSLVKEKNKTCETNLCDTMLERINQAAYKLYMAMTVCDVYDSQRILEAFIDKLADMKEKHINGDFYGAKGMEAKAHRLLKNAVSTEQVLDVFQTILNLRRQVKNHIDLDALLRKTRTRMGEGYNVDDVDNTAVRLQYEIEERQNELDEIARMEAVAEANAKYLDELPALSA